MFLIVSLKNHDNQNLIQASLIIIHLQIRIYFKIRKESIVKNFQRHSISTMNFFARTALESVTECLWKTLALWSTLTKIMASAEV